MSDMLIVILFFIGVFGMKLIFTLRILNEAQSRKTDDDD